MKKKKKKNVKSDIIECVGQLEIANKSKSENFLILFIYHAARATAKEKEKAIEMMEKEKKREDNAGIPLYCVARTL